MVQISEATAAELQEALSLDPERTWQTIVWDDPVNLMSYVSYVFRTHFGYSSEYAEELMLRVHHEGKTAVAEGTRDEMVLHVEAMHGYGLSATVHQLGAP